jgi:hypothetical protein
MVLFHWVVLIDTESIYPDRILVLGTDAVQEIEEVGSNGSLLSIDENQLARFGLSPSVRQACVDGAIQFGVQHGALYESVGLR